MAVNGHTNQAGPDHRAGRRRLRRARGGRMLTGVHVLASVLLALAAVVFFTVRHSTPWAWNMHWRTAI